jgi:NAD(P)-dependent dehydrogenase (short-subunit alcohol dehydrogenase family)
MDLDINGLRVLVTAGGNGIGLAIAQAFAAEGARVHVCDIDGDALAKLAVSHPGITQTYCDVANRPAVQDLFNEVRSQLGGLDALINNAGLPAPLLRSRICIPRTGIAASTFA